MGMVILQEHLLFRLLMIGIGLDTIDGTDAGAS
jgi:hypothetical protein